MVSLFPKKQRRFAVGRYLQPLGKWLSAQAHVWLVDHIPMLFDAVLQWLSRRQLLVLATAVGVLCLPLLTTRPSLWQQAMISLLLLVVGQFIVRLEEQTRDNRTSEALHLFLIALSLLTTGRY
ncbi:MAG: hypothetical protein AAFW75_24765, partial [Cyanobacteria bacterium J06636_16]